MEKFDWEEGEKGVKKRLTELEAKIKEKENEFRKAKQSPTNVGQGKFIKLEKNFQK